MKNILIANYDAVVRLGVSSIVKNALGEVNISFSADLEKTISHLEHSLCDLLIMDIKVKSKIGARSIESLILAYPLLKILILTDCDEFAYGQYYLKKGVLGYCLLNAPVSEIQIAVRDVFNGTRYLSNAMMKKLCERYLSGVTENPFSRLSAREFEIAQLMLKGISGKQAANSLFLGQSTISTHKMRIFKKLGISNMVELISQAKKYEMLSF